MSRAGRPPRGKNGTKITIPMVTRMHALRNVGLSSEAIARVISLDWAQPVTRDQVRRFCPAIRDGWYGGAAGGIAGVGREANVANLPVPGRVR